jgi:hypothetical protein
MIKIVIYAYFLFALFSCKAQKIIYKQDTLTIKKNLMSSIELIVTDSSEKLDIDELVRNGKTNDQGDINNSFYTWIVNTNEYYQLTSGYKLHSAGFIKIFFPNNSYFMLEKTFYSNGNIKEKGLRYADNGFRKGVWYKFNEHGILISKTDYDEPFKFTWEMLLDFLKKENIPIPQGHRRVGGWQTIIERSIFSTLDGCVWQVEWLKGNYTNEKDNIEVLTINGTTGEVVKKSYRSFQY